MQACLAQLWLQPRRWGWAAPYVVLAFVCFMLHSAIATQKNISLETARANFTKESDEEARSLARSISHNFALIYQGIRTLARLPNIRNIDRHGENFNADAKSSAQEIYNNLAHNVAVSEVYIVPREFDPDRIDPTTNKPERPIAEFDELIVGKVGEADDSRHREVGDGLTISTHEEVEIYEYRLMQEQIAQIAAEFPHESRAQRLSYPAIAGREVLTCDNTRYSLKHPNDDDRKGLVYSVPFYGSNGQMRGMISAVILTNAIREFLPDTNYRLINSVYDYQVAGAGSQSGVRPSRDLKKASNTASTIYANSFDLEIPDLNGGWQLHATQSDTRFWARADTKSALSKAKAQNYLLLAAALVGSFLIYYVGRQRRMVEQENMRLEEHVEQRTQALKEALSEAETANDAKSQFLARMSHEIRTPISGVLGLANLLGRTELNKDQRRKMHLLRRSASILQYLVNDILDLSKIEAGEMAAETSIVDVQVLLHSLVGTFEAEADSKNIRIEVNVADGVPSQFVAQLDHLERVLLNLISNAVKFTNRGKVSVEVRAKPSAAGQVETLEFDVTDTGIGIAPDVSERIFEPFGQADESITRRFGGTGLGLNISRALAEEMDGDIQFTSKPGKGSSFVLTIPIASVDERIEPAGALQTGAARNALDARVLLVEDNLVNREVAKAYLADCGCSVELATTGHEAIRHARSDQFDLILMDCQMPELDGYMATVRIREWEKETNRRPVPIVALTAHALSDDKDKCLACGMNGYLSKPFTAHQLYELIIRHLPHQL